MDDQISIVIMALAILVMLYSVWLAISLRAKVPGGVVGRSWRILMVLVGFFGIGYVVIPFLGDLPVLGNLFKTKTRSSNKQEMLIFITPKMITDRAAAR